MKTILHFKNFLKFYSPTVFKFYLEVIDYLRIEDESDPGEVKWVNFHPPPPPFFWAPSFFFFLSFKYWPQTPQPGFGSIILLQIFTPH